MAACHLMPSPSSSQRLQATMPSRPPAPRTTRWPDCWRIEPPTRGRFAPPRKTLATPARAVIYDPVAHGEVARRRDELVADALGEAQVPHVFDLLVVFFRPARRGSRARRLGLGARRGAPRGEPEDVVHEDLRVRAPPPVPHDLGLRRLVRVHARLCRRGGSWSAGRGRSSEAVFRMARRGRGARDSAPKRRATASSAQPNSAKNLDG